MKEEQENKPPILKSWKNLYLLVIINLAITIVVFYFLSEYLK